MAPIFFIPALDMIFVEIFNIDLCWNDPDKQRELEELEARARADGYNVMYGDGNGFTSYAVFEDEDEAIQFKLTYL